jgi:hypothetical protein
VPYLLGKGMGMDDIVEFHRRAQEVMRHNVAPGGPEHAAAETRLAELMTGLRLAPGRFQAPAEPMPVG